MLSALIYFAVIGVVFFIFGRVMPKDRIDPRAFPFRLYAFEKDDAVYRSLLVHRWQNHVPDMSRILPCLVPPKQLDGDYRDRLPDMIRETCAAELTHLLEAVAGLWCLHLWPGAGGLAMASLCILINLPFILIQRYNRPRFLRLLRRCGLASEETMHYETKESCCGL